MSNPPETPGPGSASSPPTPARPYINTRSAHSVKLWIQKAKKEGRLKDCWHLGIDQVTVRAMEESKVVEQNMEFYFVPGCAHHSFESYFAHISDDMQLEILQHNLGNDPISCPKNCTFYENHRWGWTKHNTRRIVAGLYGAIRELLKGFAGLPWQTQISIVGLFVLIVSPKWVPLLISLAKAIWVKTP